MKSILNNQNSPAELLGLKNPLIVALDVDSAEKALDLADDLSAVVGGFKVGPRLVHRYGLEFTQKLAKLGPVFVDCKFFDITSTMESAIRASFESGASLVTVHALAGAESLTKLAAVERELSQIRPFKILAVTVLTSWSQDNLPESLKSRPIGEHVVSLAKLVKNSGLTGLVCSPHELSLLRDLNMQLVTPGVRFDLQDFGDQKRVMGPGQAMQLGAHALVVGRPILEAKNPKEAAIEFSLAIMSRK